MQIYENKNDVLTHDICIYFQEHAQAQPLIQPGPHQQPPITRHLKIITDSSSFIESCMTTAAEINNINSSFLYYSV